MVRILGVTLLLAAVGFAGAAGPGGETALSADPDLQRQVLLSPGERATVRKGKIVLRDIPNPGRSGRTFEAIGVLPGSLDEAVAVLTDYGCYPDYMPNVGAVKLCETTGPCSVVEIELRLPLGVKKRYRLKFTGSRDEAGFELGWEMVPWPELKPSQTIADTSGFWLIRGFEEGGLIAVYHVYTDPGRVPLGLKGMAQAMAKDKIPAGILKLRARILEVTRPVRKSAPGL